MSRLFLLLSLLLFATAADAEPFRPADGSLELQFPRDHGAHPEYETEWWYFTGHMTADDGSTHGAELTFFRVGIDPKPTMHSEWTVSSTYLVHFALTDDRTKTFSHSEFRSRGNFQEAGAEEGRLKVWAGKYAAELNGDALRLNGTSEIGTLDLSLTAVKPPVLHGEHGLSRKGPLPGEASYYSTLPRLVGDGTLTRGGKTFRITESSFWMDHEVMTTPVVAESKGWDWFAVQLESGDELMVYQLRERGRKTERSSGTYVPRSGPPVPLSADEFSITVRDHWTSQATGIRYPSAWTIRAPKLGLELEVTPTVAEQELATARTTGVTYWEGRCRVTGKREGQQAAGQANGPVSGNAYVELVGYGSESEQAISDASR